MSCGSFHACRIPQQREGNLGYGRAQRACQHLIAGLLKHRRRASPVAPSVEDLPVIKEMRVRSLGQEDPLEKGMETHSSSLALRVPWIEKPGGL